MRRNDSTYGVDLFVDLLVRADTRSYIVGDEAELEEMLDRNLVSRSKDRGSRRGSASSWISESGHLLEWLHDRAPFMPGRPVGCTPRIWLVTSDDVCVRGLCLCGRR